MFYSKLFSIIPLLLILLLLPTSAFSASNKATPDMKIMGSVLSQADHYRMRGDGIQQQQAIALYGQAAEQGSAVAQYWLGRMHFAGKGVAADSDKAEEWLGLAAKQDYSPAKDFLFEMNKVDIDESIGPNWIQLPIS